MPGRVLRRPGFQGTDQGVVWFWRRQQDQNPELVTHKRLVYNHPALVVARAVHRPCPEAADLSPSPQPRRRLRPPRVALQRDATAAAPCARGAAHGRVGGLRQRCVRDDDQGQRLAVLDVSDARHPRLRARPRGLEEGGGRRRAEVVVVPEEGASGKRGGSDAGKGSGEGAEKTRGLKWASTVDHVLLDSSFKTWVQI